ncbi:ATP-binding protein [Streptomyces hypolithicus]
MTDVARSHSWRIPREPGAFAHARALVRTSLETWDWPPERIEVMVLLVSELVTNAHRHAGTDAWLELSPTPDGARLTVRDSGRQLLAPRTPDLRTAGGGFGLLILDRTTVRWGVEADIGGKAVWAHVLRTPAGPV